jgi:dihydropteroate synthase
VTPDSFSDGGLYFEADAAIAHGKQLIADGADILDIGGESIRPGAEPVPVEEELRRVVPVVEGPGGGGGADLDRYLQVPGARTCVEGRPRTINESRTSSARPTGTRSASIDGANPDMPRPVLDLLASSRHRRMG